MEINTNLTSPPRYRCFTQYAEDRAEFNRRCRLVDIRTDNTDGASPRASDRIRQNRVLRLLDWQAFRAGFGVPRWLDERQQ